MIGSVPTRERRSSHHSAPANSSSSSSSYGSSASSYSNSTSYSVAGSSGAKAGSFQWFMPAGITEKLPLRTRLPTNNQNGTPGRRPHYQNSSTSPRPRSPPGAVFRWRAYGCLALFLLLAFVVLFGIEGEKGILGKGALGLAESLQDGLADMRKKVNPKEGVSEGAEEGVEGDGENSLAKRSDEGRDSSQLVDQSSNEARDSSELVTQEQADQADSAGREVPGAAAGAALSVHAEHKDHAAARASHWTPGLRGASSASLPQKTASGEGASGRKSEEETSDGHSGAQDSTQGEDSGQLKADAKEEDDVKSDADAGEEDGKEQLPGKERRSGGSDAEDKAAQSTGSLQKPKEEPNKDTGSRSDTRGEDEVSEEGESREGNEGFEEKISKLDKVLSKGVNELEKAGAEDILDKALSDLERHVKSKGKGTVSSLEREGGDEDEGDDIILRGRRRRQGLRRGADAGKFDGSGNEGQANSRSGTKRTDSEGGGSPPGTMASTGTGATDPGDEVEALLQELETSNKEAASAAVGTASSSPSNPAGTATGSAGDTDKSLPDGGRNQVPGAAGSQEGDIGDGTVPAESERSTASGRQLGLPGDGDLEGAKEVARDRGSNDGAIGRTGGRGSNQGEEGNGSEGTDVSAERKVEISAREVDADSPPGEGGDGGAEKQSAGSGEKGVESAPGNGEGDGAAATEESHQGNGAHSHPGGDGKGEGLRVSAGKDASAAIADADASEAEESASSASSSDSLTQRASTQAASTGGKSSSPAFTGVKAGGVEAGDEETRTSDSGEEGWGRSPLNISGRGDASGGKSEVGEVGNSGVPEKLASDEEEEGDGSLSMGHAAQATESGSVAGSVGIGAAAGHAFTSPEEDRQSSRSDQPTSVKEGQGESAAWSTQQGTAEGLSGDEDRGNLLEGNS